MVQKRQCSVETRKKKFHMYVDTSLVEVFVNDGEKVFTIRIFSRTDRDEIRFFANGGNATFIAEKWDI